jgi:DNA polymerase
VAGSPRRLLVSVHPAATLYDRSQREKFETAIATAADLAGVGTAGENGDGTGEGQSRLGDY